MTKLAIVLNPKTARRQKKGNEYNKTHQTIKSRSYNICDKAEDLEFNTMEIQQQLKKKISLIQQILDVMRKLLHLQTKLEKLKTEEMVRRICKEEELDIGMENLVVATIWCESSMNPKAINKNKNGTIDYGLCQFNDYWYGSVISPQEALNNPEKAVRIMCQQFKKGRAKDWICYRRGLYFKYL